MKKLSIFALAALAFAACETPEPPAPEFVPEMSIDVTSYEAANAEDELIFNIETNVDWYAATDAEWVEIAPAEGTGSSAVIVTIAANEGYDPREAVIVVSASNPEYAATLGEKTVTITQDEAKAMVVGASKFKVGPEATSVEINLSTNVEYTVEYSADWLSEASIASTRALEEKTIVVAVAANDTYDDREGFVTITSELGTDKVTITQEQKRAVVLGETTEFEVAAEGGVIEIPLKRNTIFRTSTSVEWITRVRETRALEDDIVKFEVAANEAVEARTGYIYFETDESCDSVTVNQAGSVNAIVTIPDARFAKFLRDNYDTNGDKEISVAELQAITDLNLSKRPASTARWTSTAVSDFTGIEYMTNLETLDITNAKATSIDLSNCTKLTKLVAADTKLTSLDVSALTELTYLNVGASPITALDLSKNTKLTYLCVSGAALTELNVSALTELTVLDCAYNKLTSLDVAANTKLVGLYCNGNQLTALNVAALSDLERLNCEHNQITAVDVTANSKLVLLNCGRNKLTSLNVAGLANLVNLSAPYNMTLSSVDLTGLSSLRNLTLPHTGVTAISTAACPKLVQVNVNESPYLTSLDITASPDVRGITIDGTSLVTMDVSNQPKLGSLFAKDPYNEGVTTTPLESITLPETTNLNKIPAGFFKFASTQWLGGFVPVVKNIDLSESGIANCYIVADEGAKYRFKANIKGNGVPTLSGDNIALAPTKARILWAQTQTTNANVTGNCGYPANYGAVDADKMVVPSSVRLEGGYVHFETSADMPNGNVGIAVTDNNGKILWSWHIWICKGYDPASTDILVSTKGVDTYFMDRNIGAFCNYAAIASPNNNDHIASRGLYYQWGRKDPFVGHQNARGYATKARKYNADGTSSDIYACYGGQNLGDAVFQGQSYDEIAAADINSLVSWTVANPSVFVQGTGGSGYAWTGATKAGEGVEWTNLWGNAALTEGLGDKGGVKTMYDPCPVGYRVPSTGHYTFITSHNDQSSTGYGNPFRNWQYNTVEKIFDENGLAYATSERKTEATHWGIMPPYGLHYYSNGVKTKSEGAEDGVQDYGVLPADQESLIYFPAQGWIPYSFGCSSNGTELQYQTNRPISGSVNAYRMMCSNSGNFYYGWTTIDYGQSMGLPVRCIRDNTTPVVPDPVPDDDIHFGGSVN